METVTLKMAEQEQSDLNAVFTVTLCKLKLTDAPQKKFERLITTEQKAFVL